MCEPKHSIVQYPDDYDDSNLPFGGNMDKEIRLKAALGKAFDWARKIGKWFHLSKFGAGHSRATMEHSKNTLYLPTPTLWEGYWWDRTFHLDSWCRTYCENMQQRNAAYAYHEASVMQNMSTFRRFLETSMRNTQHPLGPYAYTEKLLDYMLTSEGQNLCWKKLKCFFWSNSHNPERLIKITMGFTRKRDLLLPHFADDENLWK
jgi:hypothetical protein